MAADKETLEVYDARASEYAERFSKVDETAGGLVSFVSDVPKGGRVLDLGCGPGTWAKLLLKSGLQVDAVDASQGMVDTASSIDGLTVWKATFEELDAEDVYDGIWANFSLLHAKREDMPAHLARLYRALRGGGRLHIGLKKGEGDARDPIGRYYTYFTVEEVSDLLVAAGFEPGPVRTGADKGLDGVVAPWFTIGAYKS